jgi:hypothetical protein
MEEVTGRSDMGEEVTSEMIEAGVLELFNYDPRFANEEDVVANIFIAMKKASTH